MATLPDFPTGITPETIELYDVQFPEITQRAIDLGSNCPIAILYDIGYTTYFADGSLVAGDLPYKWGSTAWDIQTVTNSRIWTHNVPDLTNFMLYQKNGSAHLASGTASYESIFPYIGPMTEVEIVKWVACNATGYPTYTRDATGMDFDDTEPMFYEKRWWQDFRKIYYDSVNDHEFSKAINIITHWVFSPMYVTGPELLTEELCNLSWQNTSSYVTDPSSGFINGTQDMRGRAGFKRAFYVYVPILTNATVTHIRACRGTTLSINFTYDTTDLTDRTLSLQADYTGPGGDLAWNGKARWWNFVDSNHNWSVNFTNGVVDTIQIAIDDSASVDGLMYLTLLEQPDYNESYYQEDFQAIAINFDQCVSIDPIDPIPPIECIELETGNCEGNNITGDCIVLPECL